MNAIYTNQSATQNTFESIDTIKDLKAIENITKNIADTKKENNPSNIDLIRLLRLNEDYLSSKAPLYKSNPYLEAFFIAKRVALCDIIFEHELRKIFSVRPEKNIVYQKFKQCIKNYTSTPDFKIKIKSSKKSETKRKVNTEKYIEAFLEKYARLTIIRLDLYLNRDSDSVNYTKGFFEEMMHFWGNFRRDIYESRAIPNPEGFIGSIEYGYFKGFHFHVMLIFDGSKHQRDIYIAQKIGEHWNSKITEGKGSYNNCNLKANLGGYGNRNGIGRVDHYDKQKIINLKKAAYYLTKTDFALQAVLDNERTFFRGNMPKKASMRGRKRKK